MGDRYYIHFKNGNRADVFLDAEEALDNYDPRQLVVADYVTWVDTLLEEGHVDD